MSKSASQTPNLQRKQLSKSNQGSAGAVDEDFFYGYFNSIESRELPNAKEFQETISDIIRSLKCQSEDWERRMKALKLLQSITVSAASNDDFLSHLRQLQVPLQSCLSDLRSQVVREACLCVAYMAHVLQLRFEACADAVVPYLIGLVPNSAKVMASSGMVCLCIIVKNIQSPKVLLHVTAAMNSKSNTTRRFANRLLESICCSWDGAVLGKQVANVEAALDKGLADADQEVRSTCRSAFAGFALAFPQAANKMLLSMDGGRRGMLEKELSTHPAWEVLTREAGATKRRTSCPPGTIQLGTRVQTSVGGQKKNYMSDSGDESSGTNYKSSYTSLNRSRAKATTGRPTNVMSASMSRAVDPTVMQTSTTQLSSCKSTKNSSNGNIHKTKEPLGQHGDAAPLYVHRPSASSSSSLPRKKLSVPSIRFPGYQAPVRGLDQSNNGHANSSRRYESSDDNDSETSSLGSSDLSKSSVRALKSTDSVPDIIRQLTSSIWTDKKDGLINLQNLLPTVELSDGDVKRIVAALNPLFSDTKTKIFHLLMTVVQLLIETHKQLLTDWLYTLLLTLINKQATETMTSHQKPIQETLSSIRSQFPMELLIRDCCKIISVYYQNTSMKLKVSILAFFKTVIIVSPSNILERSLSSLTPTVNILIDWTFDSKWQEIRKISNALLLKFNDLHPQVLDTISQCLPPVARQKINNLVKQPFDSGNVNSQLKIRDNYMYSKRPMQTMNANIPPTTVTQDDIDNYIKQNTEDLQALSVAYERYNDGSNIGSYNRSKQYNFKSHITRSNIDGQVEEDPYSGRLSNPGTSYMMNRFQSSLGNTMYSGTSMTRPGDGRGYEQTTYHALPTRKLSTESLGYSAYPTYDPGAYVYGQPIMTGSTISDHAGVQMLSSEMNCGYDTTSTTPTGLLMLRKISELPTNEMIRTILSELCNINQRTEQRKACLMKLINVVRDQSIDNWNDIFKTTLMRLLETLKDGEPEIRCLSLRVLQELTKNMAVLFDNFTHLTVLKVLQTHKDPDKTVVRAAEECSQVMARSLSSNLCVRVLAEIIADNDPRLNIGGLKMLLEVLKIIPGSALVHSLVDIMPGLIQTSEHDESHVRKASIFCLVEIHRRLGDDMWPFLESMSSSKMRLLKLYIDKTKASTAMTDSAIY